MFLDPSNKKIHKVNLTNLMEDILGKLCVRYILFNCSVLLIILSGEVFLEVCPNNSRDKPTLEKILVDRVSLAIMINQNKYIILIM